MRSICAYLKGEFELGAGCLDSDSESSQTVCMDSNAQRFLVELYHKTKLHQKLDEELVHLLPTLLKDHCRVVSFNKGCLLIAVDAPIWATELRYLIPELRDTLRQKSGLYQLSSIKITCVHAENHSSKKSNKKKCIALSPKACEAILSCAEECAYEPLKEALLHFIHSA